MKRSMACICLSYFSAGYPKGRGAFGVQVTTSARGWAIKSSACLKQQQDVVLRVVRIILDKK